VTAHTHVGAAPVHSHCHTNLLIPAARLVAALACTCLHRQTGRTPPRAPPPERRAAACAFLVSWGITAPASSLRAKRPRTRGRESASVLRHMYLMRLLKFRSCRFCRYLRRPHAGRHRRGPQHRPRQGWQVRGRPGHHRRPPFCAGERARNNGHCTHRKIFCARSSLDRRPTRYVCPSGVVSSTVTCPRGASSVRAALTALVDRMQSMQGAWAMPRSLVWCLDGKARERHLVEVGQVGRRAVSRERVCRAQLHGALAPPHRPVPARAPAPSADPMCCIAL